MKYDPDIVTKHLWIVLMVVVILAAIVIVFLPGIETRSECKGFQYFLFLDQRLSEDKYSVELLNGVRDVKIRSVVMEGIDLAINDMNVKSGDTFIINSARDPTNKKSEDTFRYRIAITYDFAGGISDNKDTAVCTGKVQ